MGLLCKECNSYVSRGISSKNLCYKCNNKTKKLECSNCKKTIMDYNYKKYDTLCSKCYLNKRFICRECNNTFRLENLRSDKNICLVCIYQRRQRIYEQQIDEFYRNSSNQQIIKKEPIVDVKYIRTKQDTCSICLENFKDDDDIKIISKCQHYIHSECYNLWYNNNPNNKNCPICRQLIA